jgi:aspartyl-tRNA(Asn)/glutamyl-tRNA(Gln) amidotransferase subunit B
MITKETRDKYTVAIGIECHVQLKTVTKLFAAVGNDARDAVPNTLVSHICFGLPGALPVLNKEAVHLAIRAAFALNTAPQPFSAFDRKHYFYPDLPLGYQITQFSHPIIRDGLVVVEVAGRQVPIRIREAHLEADAGKNTHPAGQDYSLVDLNRAGTPLIEIVSQPDIHSPAEARAYVRELYLLMRYADVSDCDLYYGNMRFDVNVSVSPDPVTLGTRTETKNLNSFRSVEKAAEYEINRQIELCEKGEQIIQETRGWDDTKQKTVSQRTKEDAHDYRYFPDPDLPPVELETAYIETVRAEMPLMPKDWRSRLAELGLDKSAMETLLEADVESAGVNYLALLEGALTDKEFVKMMVNWFVNLEIPLRRDEAVNISAYVTDQDRLLLYRAVHGLVSEGKLSSSGAKTLLTRLLTGPTVVGDIAAIARTHNLIQESDETTMTDIVKKVLLDNTKAAEDVRSGEAKAISFLVGQVMKQSQGRANPQLAQELIKKQLGL